VEEEPSLWARLRNLFRRADAPEDATEDIAENEGEGDVAPESEAQESPELDARYGGLDESAEPGLGSAAHAVANRGQTPDAESDPGGTLDVPRPAVTPPENFKFPWSRPGASAEPPANVDDVVSIDVDRTIDADSTDDIISIDDASQPEEAAALIEEIVLEDAAPVELAPPAEEPRKSRGFLAKLFGRSAPAEHGDAIEEQTEAVVDDMPVPVEDAMADVELEVEPVSSMDLPAEDERRDTAEMQAASEPDPFEPVASDDASDDDEGRGPGFFGRLFGRKKNRDVAPSESTSSGSSDWTSLDTRGVDAIAPRDAVPATPEPALADVTMFGGPDPFAPVKIREPGAFAETMDVQPSPEAAGQPFDDGGDQHVGAATLEAEIGERQTDEFEQPQLPAPGEEEHDTADLEPRRGFLDRLFGRKRKSGETAQAEEVEPGFLHAKFRQFYSEILRFKNQRSQVAAGFATAIVDYHADITPEATALQLSNRLKELLELQSAEASWMKGEYAQRYPNAQYAMAALADEIFTDLDWPGRTAYPQFRLETRLFKTNDADVEFFKRVDRLLREEHVTPEARDLARVYLLVLASGFKGKWQPFNLTRPIADYRRRLYEFMCGGDALMIYGDDEPLMPQSVSHTLIGQAVSRFTAAQRWTVVLVLLIASYVAIANLAWNRVSADIEDLTGRIVTSSSTRGAP
jgi:type VI secretion system protein ImpK